MTLDPEYARAPLRPLDHHSSLSPTSTPTPDHNHKRQRSQTLGATIVSTSSQSSADVLSSLISSLTQLSDSAREQARSARELDPNPPNQPADSVYSRSRSSFDAQSHFNISTEQNHTTAIDVSDGEEAEPPIAGYTRPRTKDQKRPTSKEKWMSFSSLREKASSVRRSGSSHTTILRPHSGASSSIGIPSIERGHSGSSSSLGLAMFTGRRSPLKMSFSAHPDEEYNNLMSRTSRDTEAKSMKSFKTGKSKQSTRTSLEQERPTLEPETDVQIEQQTPIKQEAKPTPETKTYSSPLSPSNREDLGEHLIPSRRSSMRHSPRRGRASSNTRSSSAKGTSKLRPKSLTAVEPEMAKVDLDEEPLDEEDSTLRRIRELRQAKERRHAERLKESRKSERVGRRSTRNRSRSGPDNVSDGKDPMPTTTSDGVDRSHLETVEFVGKVDSEPIAGPVVLEIDLPSPTPATTPVLPSPTFSISQKHKRSLSVGLRRSTSSKYRPDLRSVSEQVEAFLSAPRLTQKIRHPRTGRTIAFSEVGDPDGYAVFCCVGMGLNRFVTTFYDDVARTQKLRLITPDRPGIGESSPFSENVCTPLAWADDVAIICLTLNIDKFSLMAHSAGAIYALATALKMPDRVRGRIHLLAPWIPPSQFPNGSSNGEIKAANLPIAHKILSVLPAPFLKAANSRFLSATSASIEPRSLKARKKDQTATYDNLLAEMSIDIPPGPLTTADPASARHSSISQYATTPTSTPPPYNFVNGLATPSPSPTHMKRQFSTARRLRSPTPNESSVGMTPHARQALFNSELTHRTWSLATLKANPAADLLICFERRRPIGFKYVDVTRGVIIHHGRNDTRVPVDNAQWLSGAMKECELRILDNEGHGLMASANVMSKVLSEIGREWEEWAVIAKDNEMKRRVEELEKEKVKEMERKRFIRQGH